MKTMTKKKYAELQGLVCPVCGGKDIEGEMVDIDAGYAVQRISCLDCGVREPLKRRQRAGFITSATSEPEAV